MKKLFSIGISFLTLLYVSSLTLLITSCSPPKEFSGDSRRQDFNAGWTFRLGDEPAAANPAYDDTAWRTLTLPHDWAIEGEFSKDNPSGTGGGALPGGIGWYRKTFTVGKEDKGKRLRIDFDGVYMNSEVFINGHSLGVRPYGYVSFGYDLTPYIKWGEKNLLAVRVDNSKQPNSRWYSGCGIYRNVWLTKLNPVHVAQWGTYVVADDIFKNSARLTIHTAIANEQDTDTQAEVISILLNMKGKEVGRASAGLLSKAGNQEETVQNITVENPELWGIERPYLYTVKTELRIDGQTVDTYTTPIGIRTTHFDAQEGFFLNGARMKINGVCLHHDLGCLGAVVNIRAIERRLEILKEMGCNSIRCSHNPPAPELLDLCDRMGFLVMDETFDMWRKRKTAYDYSRYFNEWHERDLTDLILRDRNHPSVFMWSIGNEVLEQWSDAKADTLSLEEANLLLNFGHDASMLAKEGEMSVNSLLTKKLSDMVKALDPTRPVTAGCNEPSPGSHLFRSGALDIIGFNYHDDWFAGVPKNFPGKPFVVAESVSALMTRGYYRMPSDEVIICPERWDKPYYDASFSCSSYDNCHVPWGNTHEGTLRHVKNNDFISGQYVWTGFDYIGEPTPYGWPARSSYFGIVDLAGFPKDAYYLYQSEWCPEKEVLHLFPHWNWTPGQDIDMWAYYNNADEVELFVNGKSQGIRKKGEDDFHVMWRVKYEPGIVRAVSRKDGQTVLEQEIHTAGEPAQIRLTADRDAIIADGKDLSFVSVEILDKDGNLCPNAENQVVFDVQGAGFIAGVDNGSPISMEKFKADRRKAFYGKCLVVIQNSGAKGNIELTASSEGLKTVSKAIKVK
ncbi:sugar-binding domain-containing protein [Bacteroides sp. UBA939]|uniref:sugar-binding domain-containing protein n=1 Tax=Bacteroides sp. UBA939 TaxID=1946092 RepID=UPI0025C582F6|nr:sugar-binding domain-containing protein [Bacteroides sp. UBA939]